MLSPVLIRVEDLKQRAGSPKKLEVKIVAGFRSDLVGIYPKSSRFVGFGTRYIPIEEWFNFIDAVEKLDSVKVVYFNNLDVTLLAYLPKSNWNIALNRNEFRIERDKLKTDYWRIARLPGLEYNANNEYYKLPLPEGWRLFSALQDEISVTYSDDASSLILKQIQDRKNVEEIASAKDWLYDVTFADKNFHLRPAQRVAAAFIEATGYKALVSYEMGLGKTAIALAPSIKHSLRTLVICPASLKPKWAKEIYRLTGIRPIVFLNTQPQDHDVKELLLGKNQYYLCNYETVSRGFTNEIITKDQEGYEHKKTEKRFLWIDLINMAKFDLIIVDESHYAKNTDSSRSQAISRLKPKGMVQLTGTPVLNRPGEYFPTLHLLRPDLFPSEESFLRQYTYGGKAPKNVEEFKEIMKTIMIRRRQKDIESELPPKNIIDRYYDLSQKGMKAYKKAEEGVYDVIREFEDVKLGKGGYRGGNPSMSITSILAKIQRLKMICAIDKVSATADLATELHYSGIENERKHNKVLVFSQYKAVARSIHRRLGHESLCTVDAKFNSMNTNEREALIGTFQSDSKYKYLVTTLAAKEGHDITEAEFVIFNDLFWTPANHEQCEGRAYMRINDPHGIDSYYQIIDMGGASVEEWIWEMLELKASLIETIVDGVESSRDVSIASALIEKFKENMHSHSNGRSR